MVYCRARKFGIRMETEEDQKTRDQLYMEMTALDTLQHAVLTTSENSPNAPLNPSVRPEEEPCSAYNR